MVCDSNLNSLTAGTSVSISSDVGKVSPTVSHQFLDTNTPGPIVFNIGITDSDASKLEPKEGYITVTVGWEGAIYTFLLPGAVDQ